ncbi:MAG: hypothetical protein TREMPRED_002049 [Tremellales sp. Tagirdzhanova-0007]|nr:MAG: hypothetical protein TREMPRED_002049 [Tremellales sp. Tagirdzhanova-0007]
MSTPERYLGLASQVLKAGFCNPSVLRVPPAQSGNNVSEKQGNKTKRKWYPSVKPFDWPATMLGGDKGRANERKMPMMRMWTQLARIKDYEKAGGVEGLLISTSPEKLSDHGKKLRSALFYRLHTLRDELHGRELRGVAEDLDESMARERVANSGSGTGEIQERESQPLIGDR